jgi:hypothetical protein
LASASVRATSAGRALGRENFDVRNHAEHAVAHFLLKAVHHAEHDDERRHPSAMPSMDTPEMNEMKPLRRVARPARV